MAKALFTNNASGVLASAIATTGATSLVLNAGQGALFPVPSGGDYFYTTIIDVSNNKEIVKVTANAADTFTMVRAQDGTTAITFAIGSKVELRPTAAALTEKLAAGSNLSDLSSVITAVANLGLGSMKVTTGTMANISSSSSGTISTPVNTLGIVLLAETNAIGSSGIIGVYDNNSGFCGANASAVATSSGSSNFSGLSGGTGNNITVNTGGLTATNAYKYTLISFTR